MSIYRGSDPTDVAEAAVANAGSKFRLVGAVICRAHQLSEGYPPAIDGLDALTIEKPAMTALREIAAGAITVRNDRAAQPTRIAECEACEATLIYS